MWDRFFWFILGILFLPFLCIFWLIVLAYFFLIPILLLINPEWVVKNKNIS